MKTPGLVSVLIPLYNHVQTVERALSSLLRSNTERIELIVSDDASTDGSSECARRWIEVNGHRFAGATLEVQSINLGITRNLNFLLSTCRGEYLTALASDDELTDGAIDVQRRFLEQHANKDFVFANVQAIDNDGRVIRHFFSPGHEAVMRHRICSVFDAVMSWSMPWGRLFGRRAALLAFGGYREGDSFEDRWSGLKIVQAGRYGYIPDVVHRYRVRTAGTGTAGLETQRMFRDWHGVERRLVDETTGLVRALLRIRVRSAYSGKNPVLWTCRPLWWGIRMAITACHRLLSSFWRRSHRLLGK